MPHSYLNAFTTPHTKGGGALKSVVPYRLPTLSQTLTGTKSVMPPSSFAQMCTLAHLRKMGDKPPPVPPGGAQAACFAQWRPVARGTHPPTHSHTAEKVKGKASATSGALDFFGVCVKHRQGRRPPVCPTPASLPTIWAPCCAWADARAPPLRGAFVGCLLHPQGVQQTPHF